MSGYIQMRAFAALVGLASLAGLAWVYTVPPESLRTDRDGVAHFSPPIIHPVTGEPVAMGELIRHYRGD